MHIESIPVVGPLLAAGADDRIFDSLLLAGPLVIVLIAIVGRTTATEAIAIAYTVAFVAYILYKGVAEAGERKA